MHISENIGSCAVAISVALFSSSFGYLYIFATCRCAFCRLTHCWREAQNIGTCSPAATWPAVHATNAPTGSHRKEAFFPIREALIARDSAHVCLHRGAGEKENIVDARDNARLTQPPPRHLRHTGRARGGQLGPSGNCKIACQPDDAACADSWRGGGGLVAI